MVVGGFWRRLCFVIPTLGCGMRLMLSGSYAQVGLRMVRIGLGSPGLGSPLVFVLDDVGQGPVDPLLNFL